MPGGADGGPPSLTPGGGLMPFICPRTGVGAPGENPGGKPPGGANGKLFGGEP